MVNTSDLLIVLMSSVLVSSVSSLNQENPAIEIDTSGRVNSKPVSPRKKWNNSVGTNNKFYKVSKATNKVHRNGPTVSNITEMPDISNVHLASKWKFWSKRIEGPTSRLSQEDYLSKLIELGIASTSDEFCNFWNLSCKMLAEITGNTHMYIFKDKILPLWEDEKNVRGGKFVLVAPVKNDDYIDIYLAVATHLIFQKLGHDDQLCGVALSRKGNIATISLWNSDSENEKAIEDIKEKLKLLFKFKRIHYSPNQTSIKRNETSRQKSKKKTTLPSVQNSITTERIRSGSQELLSTSHLKEEVNHIVQRMNEDSSIKEVETESPSDCDSCGNSPPYTPRSEINFLEKPSQMHNGENSIPEQPVKTPKSQEISQEETTQMLKESSTSKEMQSIESPSLTVQLRKVAFGFGSLALAAAVMSVASLIY